MTEKNIPDYTKLDHPLILPNLFHPRAEADADVSAQGAVDLLIPVDANTHIGARCHKAGPAGPTILFFHGNGEIVADYDELGPVYQKMGINFIAVDYRGYGRSTGRPTVSAMMADCHAVFSFFKDWLKSEKHKGPLILMGRSLGSAVALELAAAYPLEIDGLIIESGFAYTLPLLRLLGADLAAGITEEMGFGNHKKIAVFEGPTLIIHAEFDHIIPFSDGQALYDASGAKNKKLLKIRDANHNDVMFRGFSDYMQAVGHLCMLGQKVGLP